jgi:hypothetical protein
MSSLVAFSSAALKLKTLRIYDDKNEIIARISENRLWVQPLARRVQPDFSTLLVYDRHDEEVLRIKLLHRKAVSIGGRAKTDVAILADNRANDPVLKFQAMSELAREFRRTKWPCSKIWLKRQVSGLRNCEKKRQDSSPLR